MRIAAVAATADISYRITFLHQLPNGDHSTIVAYMTIKCCAVICMSYCNIIPISILTGSLTITFITVVVYHHYYCPGGCSNHYNGIIVHHTPGEGPDVYINSAVTVVCSPAAIPIKYGSI